VKQIDQELYEAFYEEARENIDVLCNGFASLTERSGRCEKSASDELIYNAFVAAHTLTTNAAYVQKNQMQGLARAMQEILRTAHEKKCDLSPDITTTLAQGALSCQTLLREQVVENYESLLEKLKRIEEGIKS
jgi:chemotaxis protein histidine kinase CheA